MGHPSPRVLQRAQRCVEGTPKLPDATPIFHCCFCDQSKQQKAAGGKQEMNNVCLPGIMFHVDLGFFRAHQTWRAQHTTAPTPQTPQLSKALKDVSLT
jgi:hypothetical protein